MKANKVILNGETLIDLTEDSVAENAVLAGRTFHNAAGVAGTGTIPTFSADQVSEGAQTAFDTQYKYITENGDYFPDEGYDGFSEVLVRVEPTLQEKTATKNGTIVPDSGYDGLSKVTVNVPAADGYEAPHGTINITKNGTHDVSAYAQAQVDVRGTGGSPVINGIIKQYKVNAGATVNAGDFVEFVNKFGSDTFQNTTTSNLSACKLDNNRILTAYTDGGRSNRCVAAVIAIEDGVVRVGEELVLSEGSSSQCSVSAVSDRRAIVVYRDYWADDYDNHIFASVLTIDGTAITETQKDRIEYSKARGLATLTLVGNKVLVATCDGEYSTYLRITLYEIDEDTASKRTVYNESTAAYNLLRLIKINDSKVLLGYVDYFSSDKSYRSFVKVVGVDGNTVTLGDSYTIHESNSNFADALFSFTEGKLLYLYGRSAEVLTVDGNRVTRGTKVQYRESSGTAGAALLAENKVLTYYGGKAKILTVVGNSITPGTEYSFDTESTESTSCVSVIPVSDSSASVVYVGNSVGKYKSLTVNGDEITLEEMGGTFVQPATSRLQNVGVAVNGGTEGATVDVYVVHTYKVVFNAPGTAVGNGATAIRIGETLTIQLAKPGYAIDSVDVTGCTYTWDSESGMLTLSNATTDVTVTCVAHQLVLATPVIGIAGSVVTWSAIENTTSYKVYSDGTLLTTVTDTTVDLSALTIAAGAHSVTVVASGSPYADSAASEAVEYVAPLAAPALAISADTLTVTDNSGVATNYDVYVNGTLATNITGTTLDLTSLALAAGTYSLTAVGHAEGYISSAASAAVSYTVAEATE